MCNKTLEMSHSEVRKTFFIMSVRGKSDRNVAFPPLVRKKPNFIPSGIFSMLPGTPNFGPGDIYYQGIIGYFTE